MGNVILRNSLKMCSQNNSSLVVVVLGCTGTGKSKLAIDLAKRFNGEIISADSMQVYEGLDIVTNKVTIEEQNEVPHHIISCVDPLSRFTVVDFRNRVLPIIDNLLSNKKLPIVVGGTNYYIESLLWKVLINPERNKKNLLFENDSLSESSDDNSKLFEVDIENEDIKSIFKEKITQDSLDNFPSSHLHQILQQIDPVMADQLHPQDRRKVIRSLQVYQQHGKCHSDLLLKQRKENGGSSLGGPLRYKNSVMLWLQCEDSVLKKRLDERVDDMLEKGLVRELSDFHKCYNQQRINQKNSLYEEGIFQSIGFKEFHEYLILPDDEKNSKKGEKSLNKAIEDMKIITKQYARKQTKWIINRFLRKPDRQLPPVYGLDATCVEEWDKVVLKPAVHIVKSLLEANVPSQNPLPLQEELKDVPETHYCEICERIFVGRRVWEIHLKSKKHYKMKASLKKKSEAQTEIQEKMDSS